MSMIFAAMMLLAEAAPQTAPPPIVEEETPQAVDPAAVAEARDLLRATGFEEQLGTTMDRMAEDTFNTVLHEAETRTGNAMPADLRGRIHRILMEHVARTLAEMRPTALDDAARVYARYFTAAEIRELRQLQTSPVMIKMQRVAPRFMSELMQIGVAASARHMPEADAELRREIEAWQHDQNSRQPRIG